MDEPLNKLDKDIEDALILCRRLEELLEKIHLCSTQEEMKEVLMQIKLDKTNKNA